MMDLIDTIFLILCMKELKTKSSFIVTTYVTSTLMISFIVCLITENRITFSRYLPQ